MSGEGKRWDKLYPTLAITRWEADERVDESNVVMGLNDVYVPQVDQNRIPRFLARMSRLRVDKSYRTASRYDRTVDGQCGDDIKKLKPMTESSDKNQYGIIRPTTGRKVFLPQHPVFTTMFQLPGSLKDRYTGHISVKGLGSPFHKLEKKELRNAAFIIGVSSGIDDDYLIEKWLREGENEQVVGCDGVRRDWKYIPGRFFIGAAPVSHIRAGSKSIGLDKLKPDEQYPLLTGKNKPHILFHANWSSYNFADVEYLADLIRGRDNKSLTTWARQYFEKISQEIKVDLSVHPHFEGIEEGESATLPRWWGRFIVRELEKSFAEAQIVDRRKIALPDRHSQNITFGGQQDFEEVEALPKDETYGSKYLHEAWQNDLKLLYTVAELLSTEERKEFLAEIKLRMSHWDSNLINTQEIMNLEESEIASRAGKSPFRTLTTEDWKKIVLDQVSVMWDKEGGIGST